MESRNNQHRYRGRGGYQGKRYKGEGYHYKKRTYEEE